MSITGTVIGCVEPILLASSVALVCVDRQTSRFCVGVCHAFKANLIHLTVSVYNAENFVHSLHSLILENVFRHEGHINIMSSSNIFLLLLKPSDTCTRDRPKQQTFI